MLDFSKERTERLMYIVCLDAEGVILPEIWVEVARKTGIEGLKKTTRDVSNYDTLMKMRLALLKENKLSMRDIEGVIQKIDPLSGALSFLNAVRSFTQLIILSDTFEQFARPLMKKLEYPTIMCNSLLISPEGEITGYKMRCAHTKLTTVRAFHSIGYKTIAAGDSFNDLEMIHESEAGFLFRSTEEIKKANPEIVAYEEYDELLSAIKEKVESEGTNG